MKKISIALYFTAAALFFLASCDKIQEPFLKPIGHEGPGPGQEVRKVLLEDYTGHKCPNCPEGAQIASNMITLYQDKIVLLTVHAGYYSAPDASGLFTDDFRTQEGTAWNDFFGFQFYPAGMVNRTSYQGSRVLLIGSWENAIAALIDKPQQAELTISNTYDPDNRNLQCRVDTKFLENMEGIFNLSVVLVESGIIAPQQTDTGIITNYEHNHVLRASLNSTWGEIVGADGSANVDDVNTNEYTFVLDPSWNETNCAVIAFVYNTSTHEIVQAEEETLLK
jgi:hypothetical protein